MSTKTSASAQSAADIPANSFATTLAQLGKGNTLAELSTELNRTVRAVRDTGKRGKLVYTLVIEPVDGTDGAQVVLTDKIKCDTPSPDRKSSLFFTTDTGDLTRRDPNQAEFPFGTERAQTEAAERRDAEGKVTLAQLKSQAK